jgi:hypothetical protein
MSHWGRYTPDTSYTKLPLRRIVKRYVVVDFDWPYYPEHRIELECGHTQHDGNQKHRVRCGECGKENL